MPYEHLRFEREVPVNQRRPRQPPRVRVPADPAAHGSAVLRTLQAVRAAPAQAHGYDQRQLLKIRTQEGVDPGVFGNMPGVEVLSQEGETVVLAFATPQALATFEARLGSLSAGQQPTRREILFALEAFDQWSAADRSGWALTKLGLPAQEPFFLDVELWPLTLANERQRLVAHFERFCQQANVAIVDSIRQPSLLLFRLELGRVQVDLFLNHRDVRTVDLPPTFALAQQLLELDLADVGEIPPPPDGAPGVVVLDSGTTTGHPLLAPAIGEAAGFVAPARLANDENGHGTLVSGIALYGDVGARATERRFVPELRLFSGRVLDHNAAANRRLIENQVEEAVRYFHAAYGCRVFNFSYGDLNRPFNVSGRAGRMAYTLDRLARELDILFVVPTGNFDGVDGRRINWRDEYPRYLGLDEAGLIDPAPAANAITVGSIARWDADFMNQRFAPAAETLPVARRDCPSPFTRHGPGINDAIKPELVAYGGNWAVMARAVGPIVTQGLGELSTSREFAAGRLLAEQYGTSFAAPHVAYSAAKLLRYLPAASPNLIRALLVANAEIPAACQHAFPDDADELRKVCGYGRIDDEALFESTDEAVTLYAEAAIRDKRNHIYEIPLPEDFLDRGRRNREISVSLAFTPSVSTTRLDYLTTKLSFRLVRASSLDEVSAAFNANTPDEEHEGIAELTNGRTISARARSRGTVQSSQWVFRTITNQMRTESVFVVVTRNNAIWGGDLAAENENYALVVRLRDRGHLAPRLYAQVRARLEARIRQRVQI
jgi:hypothetical protein